MADEQVSWNSSDFVTDEMIWTLSDHLGTVRDLATFNPGNDTTTVQNHRQIDSFGNVVTETNDSYGTFIIYTRKPLDADTGLQNNWHRWYVSGTGVWMSEDPIGFRGGDSNVLRYVANQATSASDPTGLATPQAPGQALAITNTYNATVGAALTQLQNAYNAVQQSLLDLQRLLASPNANPAQVAAARAQLQQNLQILSNATREYAQAMLRFNQSVQAMAGSPGNQQQIANLANQASATSQNLIQRGDIISRLCANQGDRLFNIADMPRPPGIDVAAFGRLMNWPGPQVNLAAAQQALNPQVVQNMAAQGVSNYLKTGIGEFRRMR